jgi:rubrerythrin
MQSNTAAAGSVLDGVKLLSISIDAGILEQTLQEMRRAVEEGKAENAVMKKKLDQVVKQTQLSSAAQQSEFNARIEKRMNEMNEMIEKLIGSDKKIEFDMEVIRKVIEFGAGWHFGSIEEQR